METLSLPTIKSSGPEKTNGFYPSDADRDRVAVWVQLTLQNAHDPPLSKPWTIHLNTLLGRTVEADQWATTSFWVYRLMIEELQKINAPDRIMPSLYIPLECSETLIAGPVEAKALLEQVDKFEPPSLYLTSRSDQWKLRQIEQYQFPLEAADFMPGLADIYMYYSATRSLDDIKQGWEYGRNIVAEYYPKKYRP